MKVLPLAMVSGAAVFAAVCGAGEPGAPVWAESDGRLGLRLGDEAVWTFHYGGDVSKPYFDPVAVPGIGSVTWAKPPDHPWHYGLWFSWKFINGVNYWEEDKATGRAQGRTSWANVEARKGADHSARIAMDLAYGPWDGEPLLRERRVIDIAPPASDGTVAMDWTMTFTAAADLVLDRTPLPDEPGGKPYGGYAGLSLRLAGNLEDRQAVATRPLPDWAADRIRVKAEALEYSGTLGGRAVGLAVLAHPDNLNAPSPWYVIRSKPMSFFSPAVLCYGPHAMKKGDAFGLRYRVVIHPGRWDDGRLRAAWEGYVQPKAGTTP